MKRYASFLMAILLMLLVSSVWAQDETEAADERPAPLSYGTPVQGSISGTRFQQSWALGTASADRIQVNVTRTDGNLLPDVSVLDETGIPIAQSYGPDQTSAFAQIADFTLPARGNYIVQVSRYNGETGETKGGYTLEVVPLGTAPENPNNQTIVGELVAETPASGEITATHWLHRYTYTAEAADLIQVVVERTGGTLLPLVDVLDANGISLRTGYNDYAIADTQEFELPGPGEYTIAVKRYQEQAGESLGTYTVALHLLGAGEGNPALEVAAGEIAYDTPVSGEITPARWYEDWQFTTEASDTISIIVNSTGGDLYPELALLGGSGQELTHGYTDQSGASATINRYNLDAPGTYTVRVLRYNGKTGSTSGTYSLTVTLNGTGEDSAALDEPVGEVTLGEPVQGEITNAQWQNAWTFEGEEGTIISVTAERTSGTLTPVLEIRDSNGQALNSAYYLPARDISTLSSYSLPGTGTYQIVVLRDGGQGGYTEGEYTLTVSTAS